MKTKLGKKSFMVLLAIFILIGTMPMNSMSSGVEMVTVTQGEDYKRETIDCSNGLFEGEIYGDESLATVGVFEDMPIKSNTAETIDGVTYDGYIQGQNNAKRGDNNAKDGVIPTSGSVFKIESVVDATITFVTKEAANKAYYFVEDTESEESESYETGTSVPKGSLTFNMVAGKTYYFYLNGSKPCVYGIILEAGTLDLDWSQVEDPVLGIPSVSDDSILVPYTAVIGDNGGESLVVSMYKDGELLDTQMSKAHGSSGKVTFKPVESGTYIFKSVLSRTGQTDKVSNEVSVTFKLPLAKPIIDTVVSKGSGNVEITYGAVPEAEIYEILYGIEGSDYSKLAETSETTVIVQVPKTGIQYGFKVAAIRDGDRIESDEFLAEIADEAQETWTFSAFGQGVNSNTADCGFSGSAADGTLTVWNLNNKGKLVPASTDGLSFYYTAIPSSLNFTLKAKVTIDEWKYTNGQEGFGLMAADRVGINGDSSVFWNNSYMNTITKVEYFANKDGSITDDTSADKITMKLGIGSQEKINVTKENLPLLEANDDETIHNVFSTKMRPLETSCATKGTGTYNIVGNYTNSEQAFLDSVVDDKVTFDLSIQRNNTGYFLSYTDGNGNTVTNKYYERDALSVLDPDNIYVGFFAARTCNATFTDIQLTTINPEEDKDSEIRPITKVTPSYNITSEDTANSENYNLTYISNADGHVIIRDSKGNMVGDKDVKAGIKYTFKTKLDLGVNKFTAEMTPDPDYKPSEFEELSSYEPVKITKTVTYKVFDRTLIYVSPKATLQGIGSKDKPMDIYTAVEYATPGQKIVLMEGNYKLNKTVTIGRGINGTPDNLIYMIADPDSSQRPVLDFNKSCEGMVIAGNYWYFQGFDVTNSINGKDGIRLGGNHVTMDNINTYHNGNTGLQVSRYLTTDNREDWPSNNLILNCTSYGNADAGYEDADGFAAKLTIGEGIVFDGCIAYNNADDGWDLFAKPETGPIGTVTIKNCVAYGNGYLEDGTIAGNGNGFKMGGASITGYHKLINSVSFDNKAKGIDSNSCPDIEIYNSTSFNNESYNVALYTNDAPNTDFYAEGIISFRRRLKDIGENIKLRGTQDESKVYQDTNYFWNFTGQGANNSNGLVKEDWFLSLDTGMNYSTHRYESLPITRNEDNTINMNELLVLSDIGMTAVGEKAGALINTFDGKVLGQASPVIEVIDEKDKDNNGEKPNEDNNDEKPNEDNNENGDINQNDNKDGNEDTSLTDDKKDKDSNNHDTNLPKTGDTNHLTLYIILMLVALIVGVGALTIKKKVRK